MAGQYDLVVEFTLNDSSVGFVETPGPTVSFGVPSEGHTIPGVGGVNAIAESQAAYGVLEERINVRGYTLTTLQALRMATGIVLANIGPRAIRDFDLGWKGSTIALFDDRGRLFGTPGGGEGLLVGVNYQDDFISVTGGKRVRIEETIEGAAGFVPTEAVWLLTDETDYWLNDDGSLSEPA